MAFTFRCRAHLSALALALGACARHEPAGHPGETALSDAAVAPTASEAGAVLAPPLPPYPWAEAVRLARWSEADRGLDALPPDEKRRPEVRYVTARVALERHDEKRALPLLDGLERDLPLLADDIARRRADAELRVGPFLDAGEYFLSRGTPSGWLHACEAFAKAKEEARARTACDRVLGSEKRTRAHEAAARALRISLGGRAAGDDAADARWLAIEAADLAEGTEGLKLLGRLDPAHPLGAEDWVRRAHLFAEAGMTDEALRALDRAATAGGRAVPLLTRLHAKADVLFKTRGRALEASRVYDDCARRGGPAAGEDAFHAARALSRADHDDEAIERYGAVARRYPNTSWADESTFLAARLELLHGRYKKASADLDEYVKRFPSGAERREAARLRPLAHLLAGDVKAARRLFEQVADEPGDPLAAATAVDLGALAALRDGDRTHALARWTEIARTRPLTWPALVARARLAQAGAPVPPAIDPPTNETSEPLALGLPPPADVLHRVGLDGDAEARVKERESVVSGAASGGRGVEAVCGVYGLLGRAKRRYQVAQQIPPATLSTAPSGRTRWAWDCLYPAPYEDEVVRQENETKLSAALLYAVMRQESGYDPDAVSPARAVGLLQLMPETAKIIDAGAAPSLTEPGENLRLGARYLHDLVDRFDGQVPLAVAGYNGGPDAVERWLARFAARAGSHESPAQGDVELDVFVEQIPYAETRAYVVRVMGNYARYAFLRGGESAVPRLDLSLGKLAKEEAARNP